MRGLKVRSFYGVAPHGGDLDGDPEEEMIVCSGPDPARSGRLRGFEATSTVVPFPSLDLTPSATYGITAALAPLPY